MYCQNCGCENHQDATFCHQCEKKLIKIPSSTLIRLEEENKLSSELAEKTNNSDKISFSATKKYIKINAKKTIISLVSLLLVVVSIASLLRISNEKCDWCNDNPSIRFKTNDGGDAYVCIDCCKECAWCGEVATKHYENLLEMIVFVCKDCYDEIKN